MTESIRYKVTLCQLHSDSAKHCSYFVINICDVHTVEDIIFEIILQYSPQNVKRNVGPEKTKTRNPLEIQRTDTSETLYEPWMEFFFFFSFYPCSLNHIQTQ